MPNYCVLTVSTKVNGDSRSVTDLFQPCDFPAWDRIKVGDAVVLCRLVTSSNVVPKYGLRLYRASTDRVNLNASVKI